MMRLLRPVNLALRRASGVPRFQLIHTPAPAYVDPADVDRAWDYCETQLEKIDRPSIMVSQFLLRSSRPLYLALRSLNAELLQLPDTVPTPELRAARAAFWRDAIQETFDGAPPREPICILLAYGLRRAKREHEELSFTMLKHWALALIRARSEMMDNQPYISLSHLEDMGEKIYSNIMYSALATSGIQSTEADHIASHIGKCLGIVAVLRGVPILATPQPTLSGQIRPPVLLLPLDIMGQCGVKEETIFRKKKATPELVDAVFEVAARANSHLVTARELLQAFQDGREGGHAFEYAGTRNYQSEQNRVDWATSKPAFGAYIEAAVAAGYLENLQKADFNPFNVKRNWEVGWRMWKANKTKMF